ncbi:MAG: class I SAM-dependent methyltransferase [Selenomonadaceae bacterium]|nr:class I SAM-dependent methyltransferase [Selenomonadaceae bacterium]
MHCVIFGRDDFGKPLFDLICSAKLRTNVELVAFFDLYENSSRKIYKCRRSFEQNNDDIVVDEVPSVEISLTAFDKFFIFGWDYDLREQFHAAGIDYKKIAVCYGAIFYCCSPLDEIFVMPKSKPDVPFKKAPAEIYQHYVGETAKSHDRRQREGFFDKYCNGEGLDIGYGADLIVPNCSGWDLRNGDAQYLEGIPDESFDFVYSSHCLEHMFDVQISLKNWFRVVRKGGWLILAVPHRELYEKKSRLPSRWNIDHKHMFLIGRSEEPDTLDIIEEIKAALTDYDIEYVKTCDEGHTITDPLVHSDGEYQIEIVIRKLT